jgi:hypothetical protein
MRSIVRRRNSVRDWGDGPFLALYTNGNASPYVVQGIVSPCDVQVSLRTHSEQNTHAHKWGHRLSELADYHDIHGHCTVPVLFSENTKLGHWVGHQRAHYNLYIQGKTSPTTTFKIQALESLDFSWDPNDAQWKQHLSELAEFRKEHQHCNVQYLQQKTSIGKLG